MLASYRMIDAHMIDASIVWNGPGALEAGPVCCGGAEEGAASKAYGCIANILDFILSHYLHIGEALKVNVCQN
jgi:hypothetical protein